MGALTPYTDYIVRAFATNKYGTSYGNRQEFKTLPEYPGLLTTEPTEVTDSSAKSGGVVFDAGGVEVTERGIYFGETTIPEQNGTKIASGSGNGPYSITIPGLLAGKNYYVKAYAINQRGQAVGNLVTFKTLTTVPKVATADASEVQQYSAKAGGSVLKSGGLGIQEKGIYFSVSQNPQSGTKVFMGTGSDAFSGILTGLSPNTRYYYVAFARNSLGTGYGAVKSFTTSAPLTVLSGEKIFNPDLTYGTENDVDGNTYKTIAIGTQVWFAENLKTTKYNDGTAIPNITGSNDWISLTTPAYCWYENNIENRELTGAKYNWFAASSGKVCPAGWHVPTDAEWTTLTNYLGGQSVAGAKLKETGTTHWAAPNTGATNSSGFTSLPGGQRQEADGSFTGLGIYDIWWSSTPDNTLKSWYRSNSWLNTEIFQSAGSLNVRGFSIRCLKN
jgi:uncharacterized protein (TIGR02145 family)